MTNHSWLAEDEEEHGQEEGNPLSRGNIYGAL